MSEEPVRTALASRFLVCASSDRFQDEVITGDPSSPGSGERGGEDPSPSAQDDGEETGIRLQPAAQIYTATVMV